MPTRNRTISAVQSGGKYGSFTRTVPMLTYKCTDTVGAPKSDHPLTITKNFAVFPTVSGTQQSNGKVVTKFVMDANTVFTTVPGFPTGIPSFGASVTKVLAYTNPNRPAVDMPVFLFELKDIPNMLKRAGKKFEELQKLRNRKLRPTDKVKIIAKNNLEVQFGWLPYVTDIWKMLHFQESVNIKLNELQRLYSTGGLRRRFSIWENTDVLTSTTTLQSSNFSCVSRYTRTRRQKVWGTIRWRPQAGVVPPASPGELLLQAKLAANGMMVNGDTLQKAMPWTWLIGWFSNLDECVGATRNNIPVVPENACIMNQLDGRYDYTAASTLSAGLTFTPGYQTTTVKTRAIDPTPTSAFEVYWPIISTKQWSILSSIVATRFL